MGAQKGKDQFLLRCAWQGGKRRDAEAEQSMDVGECRLCRWAGMASHGARVECVGEIGYLWKSHLGTKIEGPGL